MNSSSSSPDAASPRRHRVVRIFLRVAAGTAVLTGIIGALHFPFAAPILRTIFPGSVCPIMRGTPEQIDRAHALGAAAIRAAAASPAAARPALGFALDRTRKSDLDAWASSNRVSCGSIAGNETLQRCTDVSAAAVGQSSDLGPLEEVTFEFQSTGQLVNVQTLRRHLTPEQAAHTVAELERGAAATLGKPSSQGGEPTVAHLSRSLLATYVAVHAFTDYRATVSATNLAQTGIMVREEYLSAR
ncbi:MAG TPA: hypothetical protein VFH73_12740 [Polyangia bacterium]|nr:hypothetical protein [Polyangia bacterium]